MHKFSVQSRRLAFTRAEDEYVDLEVFFYSLNPFAWSLGFFFLAFLAITATWFKRPRWLDFDWEVGLYQTGDVQARSWITGR